jgi:cellulose synthase operon protein C
MSRPAYLLLLALLTTPALALPIPPPALLARYAPEPGPEPKYPAYFGPDDRAAAQINSGQYRRALFTLAPIAPADASYARAAVLRSRAHVALGELDLALQALDITPPTAASTQDIELQRAKTHLAAGRPDTALTVIQALLTAHPDNLPARQLLGDLHERRGDPASAIAAYSHFTAPTPPGRDYLALWRADPNDDLFTRPESTLAIATALHRHATLTGRYADNLALHTDILAMFVRVYDVIDRGNIDARLAAAEYLLSHDDNEQAVAELKAALESNPRHPLALELLARMQLQRFDFDTADSLLARLRLLAPNSSRLRLLEARSLLQQRRPDDARPLLDAVLTADPTNLQALGLLAATHALRLEEPQLQATLARAATVAPGSALAWFELAEQLAAMRQYPRAESAYLKAIELSPWWSQPLNSLGLLYTQSGDDTRARMTLERARTLDPFNLRATNYLRLLDKLDALNTLESPHFIVRFSETTDPILGQMILEYMESVRPEITTLFAHTPPSKTRIEVFPTHAEFSVRTTGQPWIPTVGASTGDVIALVAPRNDPKTLGTYNWAQVLRHEYAHTVSLSLTLNRIPHYLTEGLAVYSERAPLRWEWVPLLYMAITQDKLFDLDQLTWGFVRPRRPFDRTLAYAQSFLFCQYFIETYGRPKMLDLLNRFRDGQSEAQAYLATTGLTRQALHAAFTAHAKALVVTWGYDKISTETYTHLREQAEQAIADRRLPDALDLWLRIAALRPLDPLPHQRLAGLYLAPELLDRPKAAEHLKALHAVELKDNRYARRLARLYLDDNNPAEALRFARDAIYINFTDTAAHQLLLEAARKLPDPELVTLQQQRLERLSRPATNPAP